METGFIDDFITVEECIKPFIKEGLAFENCEISQNGTRREYLFTKGNRDFALYFAITKNGSFFLGIGHIAGNYYEDHEFDELRFLMSKGVHAIAKILKNNESTKLVQLVHEDDWLVLGANVIVGLDKFEYFINPVNYKSIKREVKEAFKNVDVRTSTNKGRHITVMGREAMNLVRAMKALGMIESVVSTHHKESNVVLNEKHGNKEVICEVLRKLGYVAF